MCIEKTPWEQVIDFHGHTCPEIALGYRVAQIAMRELGIKPTPSTELVVTAQTHSCALDAFQILNHATFGRGALKVDENKQHKYLFEYSDTSVRVTITVLPKILEHLVIPENLATRREIQNATLEAIQFILSSEENMFCTIQKDDHQ
ncbi:FmdE, molybdenum formylmethanofuran dehydrogenase operon [Desulfosporosinus acididurans]|uniref:FmdE, molybdenum formylmethanofuran dehydrogenase operon n=1 Tax=Desulfosporosinus acididurans TaxID=476652 RepID=A0A0J1FWV2_9FIRM|nr:formylmethanofuran dehydrogenase subunit E family protein [Desulfosporosinus acididurans]KLU67880.1 FmdE, molybdenum formylmethanofuran dehydrogenase operon [Desulfosporosinus acididurans]